MVFSLFESRFRKLSPALVATLGTDWLAVFMLYIIFFISLEKYFFSATFSAVFIFILWLFTTLIHSVSSLWSWMEKTLTNANKHHNTSSTWQQKAKKKFFFLQIFLFRWLFFIIEKLLDVMENHFAMSTMRKTFLSSFLFDCWQFIFAPFCLST